MKKELTLNEVRNVPVGAHLINEASKRIRKYVNRVLPEECQVKNATDCWYAGSIAACVLTMMMPFCLPLLGYCLYRAKKGERGGER